MEGKKVQPEFYNKDYFIPESRTCEMIHLYRAGDVMTFRNGKEIPVESDSILMRDTKTNELMLTPTRVLISSKGHMPVVGEIFTFLDNAKGAYPVAPTEENQMVENKEYLQNIKNLDPHARVLEIGSGFGFLLKLLISNGIYAEGCDISQYAIDNCVVDKSLVRQCDIRDGMPYPDKSFDVVVSFNTLEHIDPPFISDVIKNICRISCKWVIVAVPISMSAKNEASGDKSHVLFMHPSFWVSKFYENGYLIDWGKSYCLFNEIRNVKMNFGYFVFYIGETENGA